MIFHILYRCSHQHGHNMPTKTMRSKDLLELLDICDGLAQVRKLDASLALRTCLGPLLPMIRD